MIWKFSYGSFQIMERDGKVRKLYGDLDSTGN
jgi:hypothetical protein